MSLNNLMSKNKNKGQCEFASASDTIPRCSALATRQIGGVWLCEEHGKRGKPAQHPELTKADVLSAQIKTLEASIKPLKERLEQLRQALLEENSPFKLGDVVEWDHGNNSTRRGVVEGFRTWTGRSIPSLIVALIRKDLSRGPQTEIPPYRKPVKVSQ